MAHRTLNERDLAFYLYEMLGADELLTRPRYADHSRETFDAAMATAKQVAEKYYANHNRKGDEQEPSFDGTTVTLIPEIKAACEAAIETGLTRAGRDYEQGGMQLPSVVTQACFAWMQAANVSSFVYAFLTQSAATVIEKFGTDDQRKRFSRSCGRANLWTPWCLGFAGSDRNSTSAWPARRSAASGMSAGCATSPWRWATRRSATKPLPRYARVAPTLPHS